MEFKDSEITPGIFWRAVGMRPVGATIVTSRHGDEQSGFLGLSFAHVSADPPIVLVSVSRSTTALATITASGAFAISELPRDAETIAREFGGGVPNDLRFSKRNWETLVSGAPIYPDAPVAFDCQLHRMFDEGDTVIVLGRVVGIKLAQSSGVTLAHRGGYKNLE